MYGKVTSSRGSVANEFDFAGQQTDPTGLQYLRGRYYDTGTGTFLSREPLSAGPGWPGRPFGYVGANPVNFTDPLGLCFIWDDPSCVDDIRANNPDLAPACFDGICTDSDSHFEPNGSGGVNHCIFSQWPFDPPGTKYCQPFDPNVVTVATTPVNLSGEYPVRFKATTKAAQAIKAKRWTADDYYAVRRGTSFLDKEGNRVWLRDNGNNTFSWLVENRNGVVISARKGESLRSAQLAREAFEWPAGLVP